MIRNAGDTITDGGLADIVDNTLGITTTRTAWSVEHLKAELAADPTDTMKKYRAVFAQGIGVAWPKVHSYNETHDIPTTTAAVQWARDDLPAVLRK